MIKQADLSAGEVRRLIDYDPATGLLTWAAHRNNYKGRKGQECGTINKAGYRQVSIGGRLYYAHRLAWLLSFGCWPQGVIDHVNGVKSDNRLSNLRDATTRQNNANRTFQSGSGMRGVFRDRAGSYRASISVNARSVYLGTFGTAEEAAAAYRRAAAVEFGEFIPKEIM